MFFIGSDVTIPARSRLQEKYFWAQSALLKVANPRKWPKIDSSTYAEPKNRFRNFKGASRSALYPLRLLWSYIYTFAAVYSHRIWTRGSCRCQACRSSVSIKVAPLSTRDRRLPQWSLARVTTIRREGYSSAVLGGSVSGHMGWVPPLSKRPKPNRTLESVQNLLRSSLRALWPSGISEYPKPIDLLYH